MSAIKLTRTVVGRLPPAPGPGPVYYFDQVLKGFAVRVSPNGVKAYLVQGRVGGKLRRIPLGRYPTVSPEDARKRAGAILNNMAEGKSPERARDKVTAGEALDQWLAVHVAHKLKPRTAEDYRRIVEQTLRPLFGDRPIAEIERADMAKLHHDKSGTPRRANYILATARSFFSFCEDQGYRPENSNPGKRIKHYPENRRERFLSADELARASAAIDAAERAGVVSIFAAAGLRLCILTGARQGEIRNLTWREVDLERRMLLLEDSKTGRRPIFLNEPAIAVLEALPHVAGNPHVIVGDKAGEPYQNLTRAWIKVRGGAGLADVRLHDLRHTYASFGASESLSLPILGRLLGHRVPATTARYAHLANDPVRAAGEKIGARLAEIMTGKPASGGGSDGEA